MTKIAFVYPHCLVDFTNGAATATRDGLKVLAAHGFNCLAFCGTRLDEPGEGLIQEQLFRRKINYQVRKVSIPYPAVPSPPGHLPNTGRRATAYDARMIFLRESGIDVTLFENGSTRGGWFGPEEVNAFLAACDLFLRKNRPDVVVTYGGDPVSIAVQQLAKRLRIIVVFWLHNFSYGNRTAFEAVDCVIVPSEFSRQYYRRTLGLDCHVLPNIVHWEEAEVGRNEDAGGNEDAVTRRHGDAESRGYVTFINPQEIKGVYVFARIAREISARRPDIPILVTQGRSRKDALMAPELGLAGLLAGAGVPAGHHVPMVDGCIERGTAEAGTPALGPTTSLCQAGTTAQLPSPPAPLPEYRARGDSATAPIPETAVAPRPASAHARNIWMMPFTPDPKSFYPKVYSMTRLLLMPSLWNESFGLVAAEAMLNGIPVLASNRGALPDTIGCSGPLSVAEGTGGGFVFDIPARYTPETKIVPTAEEVAPWVDTIIRLWDDQAEYKRRSQAAREHAQQWRPERLAAIHCEFFHQVLRCTNPGPGIHGRP
jgi:glycosyltransferase involved in cell wall biosynthesis